MTQEEFVDKVELPLKYPGLTFGQKIFAKNIIERTIMCTLKHPDLAEAYYSQMRYNKNMGL